MFRKKYFLSVVVLALLLLAITPFAVAVDTDSDGFDDATEQFVGTNPNLACGINAWPVDLNNDGKVSLADVLAFSPSFNSNSNQSNYDKRFDLDMNGSISLADILRMQLYFGHRCTDFVGCFNGVKDGSESYIDCGGTCAVKCNVGNTCNQAADCVTGLSCSNGVCVTAPQQTCTDSDGGQNLGVFGITTVVSGGIATNYSDACTTSTTINEKYCLGGNSWVNQTYCPSGQICQNGACTFNYTQPNSCFDSDNGYNYYIAGYVTGINNSVNYMINDSCVGNYVNEYYCSGNTPNLAFHYYCSSGCSNGKCNDYCSDSDGGNNPGINGTVLVGNSYSIYAGNFFADYCVPPFYNYSITYNNVSNSITELYCNGTSLQSVNVSCATFPTGICVPGRYGGAKCI